MRLKLLFTLIVLIVALTPASALAQDMSSPDAGNDLLIRINGSVVIDEDERVDSVIIISGDAEILGRVNEFLLIIDGTLTVSGEIAGDVVALSGNVILNEDARVTGDINLYDSDLTQDAGAEVTGDVNEQSGFTWSAWDSLLLSIIFWIGSTVLVLFMAFVFAAIGGRQLVAGASNLTDRLPGTILAALLVGILIPIVAVLAFLTLFGIPIAITLLIVMLPMLGLLGYIVAGTGLGLALVGRSRVRSEIDHPYLAALLGVLLLQLLALIPFVGWLIAIAAVILGTGALVLVAWDAWAREGTHRLTVAPPPGGAPAAGD